MRQAFTKAFFPTITALGESVGVRSASMAKSSSRVGTRQFSNIISRYAITQHSKSIHDFITTMEAEGSRYAPAREGFTWVSSNPTLRNIAETHFKKHVENFAISSANTHAPLHTTVTIHSDFGQRTDLHNIRPASNVSAGGIPALWTAYIQSLLYKEGAFPTEFSPPVYVMPSNIRNSAAFGSSTQYHVSHASPMYTDPAFSTANIMRVSLLRNFFPNIDSPERDNYMIAEIHPRVFFDHEVIQVGLGYLYNEWKYKLDKNLGRETILDETIPLAITSGHVMDNVAEALGNTVLLRKDTVRVAYNAEETEEMLQLQAFLKNYGIECIQLVEQETLALLGTSPKLGKGGSIWSVKGDGNVIPDIVEVLIDGIRKNGGHVVEGMVSSILYSKEEERLSGLIVTGHEKGYETQTLIRTNHLFTSFGARSLYKERDGITRFTPVEPIIAGTGYSAFLLVEGEITKPIDSNNSHFTPLETTTIEDGQKLTLVKATCGGSIGTDSFCIDHAVNNLYYATHVIFPGKKIEILAVKSCSRPLNGKNSGKLSEIVPGVWALTGLGGKGITDAAGLAATSIFDELTRGVVSPEKKQSFQERYISSRLTCAQGSGRLH